MIQPQNGLESFAMNTNWPNSGAPSPTIGSGPVWPGRPQFGLGDLIVLLWREKWLMIAVFALISLLGLAFALTLQKTYEAGARVLVLLGQEYVYQPRVGGAGEGAAPKQEQIVQSEIEILQSGQLAERVVRKIGATTLFPKLETEDLAGVDPNVAALSFATRQFQRNMSAGVAPNTAVIRLGYKNENPAVAAKAVNVWVDEYLAYRRDVLVDDQAASFRVQRTEVEQRLSVAQADITNFLAANGIGDFEGERTAATALQASTQAELFSVVSRKREAEGRLAAIDARLGSTPNNIQLFSESDNSKRVLELQVQREELLSRYRPDSSPVQELDRRIARQQAALSSDAANESGLIRRGVNTVFQEMETDRARAEAEVRALGSREAALRAQLNQIQTRQLKFQAIRANYEDMLREKTILEEQDRQLGVRAETARSQTELSRSGNDNIRVVERAQTPTQGKSLRAPVFILAVLFAGVTALAAGLVRAFSRTSFPTASSVSRTLGLPVLAVVPQF